MRFAQNNIVSQSGRQNEVRGFFQTVRQFARDSQGTASVSYALMLAVVVGSALTGATLLGSRVERAFAAASTGMSAATGVETAAESETPSDRVVRRSRAVEAGVSRGMVIFLMFAVAIVSAAAGWLMLRPARKKTEAEPALPKKQVEEKVLATRLNAKRELLWKLLLADHDLLLKNQIAICHVMTCDPITINKSTSGKRIAEIIAKHQVAHLLVCGEDKKLLGVVQASDHKLNPDAVASAIVTPPEHSITPKTSLGAAISLLMEQGVSFLPVVDQGKLCGVLTPTDLVLTLHCSLQLWGRVAMTREDSSQRAEVLETTSRSMTLSVDQLKLQVQKLPEEVRTVIKTGNAAGLETQITEMNKAMSQLMQQLDNARAQIREQSSQIADLKTPAPDEATGAVSREQLGTIISQLQEKRATAEAPFSLILLVAENHQDLLSAQGRNAVDEHLGVLAECAARHLESHHQIGRYSDDTLAIFLPGSSSSEALQLGNRVTGAAEVILRRTSISLPRISIASARSGESIAELIIRAESGVDHDSSKEVERVAIADSAC